MAADSFVNFAQQVFAIFECDAPLEDAGDTSLVKLSFDDLVRRGSARDATCFGRIYRQFLPQQVVEEGLGPDGLDEQHLLQRTGLDVLLDFRAFFCFARGRNFWVDAWRSPLAGYRLLRGLDLDGSLVYHLVENSGWDWSTSGADVCQIIGFVVATSGDVLQLASFKGAF